jgi:D-beta-D-heptose 7-phosphate kinase/D-beta-D-heptose 1-phosphate adenosyltransferase
LEQARCAADRLILGLNSDLSVRRLKGAGRPVQSEVARATILSSLKPVDAVVIFSEDTPLNSVDNIAGAHIVLQRGGRVILADLVSGQSTSGTLAPVAASTGS